MASFSVVAPARNEEQNLRPTVEAILREFSPHCTSLEVLVFDDASTDATGVVADELAREDGRIRAFHNAEPLNIGGIFKAGIREAKGEYILLVPGDNEARVDEIVRGVQYLDRADLVVFYVTNTHVRPLFRRVLSRCYVWIVNALFGTRFRYTNGQNIFRTDVPRGFRICTNGFAYQTEAVVKAVYSGVDYVQVGIRIKRREFGASKALSWKNFKSVAIALGQLWWDLRVQGRPRYRHRGRLLGTF